MTRALLSAALLLAVPARAEDDSQAKGWLKRLQKVGSAVQDAQRRVPPKTVEAVKKTAAAFRKSAADISESEEFYIGRAVAADVMGRYPPNADAALNAYVQGVVQAVALASDRPLIYKGYHAQVLESNEVNAFAAPGGFVFVTTGLLKLLENEDQLACVVAHELAHVSMRHGLKTIKAARLTQAFELLAQEAAQGRTSEGASKLTRAFEGSVEDIVNQLVIAGYSRDKELEADRLAVTIAKRANYHPKALLRFLARLGGAPSGAGLLKTHPSPKARAAELAGADLSPSADFRLSPVRRKRFKQAVAKL